MSRRILILTAGFGNGHHAAARNIAAGLRAVQADVDVCVSDIFQEAYPLRARLAATAYLLAIHRLPLVWGAVFSLLDHTPAARAHIRIYRAALRVLERKISEFRPEFVVSTYPGCNHLLDCWCRGRVVRPFRTVTVITDSQSVNSAWHTAHADAFCVTDGNTASILESRGIPSRKIHATGFPVPLEFATSTPCTREPGPPWKILCLLQGSRRRVLDIVRGLGAVPGVELTVGLDRDDGFARRLNGMPGVEEAGGWLERMPLRMLGSHFYVGKAGGASIHECLAAGLPPIIVQVVPGQEEGNARLVAEAGAGVVAGGASKAAEAVRLAIASGGVLQAAMADRARALGKPRASLDIARLILQHP